MKATAATGASLSGYASRVLADGAADYWRLAGPGTPAYDLAGFNDLTVNAGVTSRRGRGDQR